MSQIKGSPFSKEHKNHLSASHLGKKFTKEHKDHISAAKKGIPRSIETRKKLSFSHMGLNNSSWKGGRKIHSSGYILVLEHKHPYADRKGYILEHRLVMEEKLGRYLKPEEIVHHIDLDRSNNDADNLSLFENAGDHRNYHRRLKQYFD